METSSDRVKQLVLARRAGTVSMRQFKARIEEFSNEELTELAIALLERMPAVRKRLKRRFLSHSPQAPSLSGA